MQVALNRPDVPAGGKLCNVVRCVLALAVLLAIAPGGASAQFQSEDIFRETSQAPSGEISAVTRARHDLKLSFPVAAVVQEVMCKPGDAVKAGDVLIELEDKEGAALIELYAMRAESDLQIDASVMQKKQAEVERDAMLEIKRQDAATEIEVDRAVLNAEIKAIELDLAKMQKDEAALQLAQAVARHERYVMRAPADGRVEEIVVEKGEAVESLKPVLRLVVADPLRVDAAVPIAKTLDMKVGDTVWVTPKLAGHDKPIAGTIIYMAAVADASSNTRNIRVELPNKGGLPAGLHVQVSFEKPAPLAKAEADEAMDAPSVSQEASR